MSGTRLGRLFLDRAAGSNQVPASKSSSAQGSSQTSLARAPVSSSSRSASPSPKVRRLSRKLAAVRRLAGSLVQMLPGSVMRQRTRSSRGVVKARVRGFGLPPGSFMRRHGWVSTISSSIANEYILRTSASRCPASARRGSTPFAGSPSATGLTSCWTSARVMLFALRAPHAGLTTSSRRRSSSRQLRLLGLAHSAR